MIEENEDDALVDGCLWLIAGIGSIVITLAILCSGCAPRYTVIPADRECVPIRQSIPDAATARRTYVEDPDAATGWYVPDATMLELLEAD